MVFYYWLLHVCVCVSTLINEILKTKLRWAEGVFLLLTSICVSTLINKILKTETGMTISFWDHHHHHLKTCRNLSFSRSVERKLRMLLSVFRLPPNSQLFCWKLSIFMFMINDRKYYWIALCIVTRWKMSIVSLFVLLKKLECHGFRRKMKNVLYDSKVGLYQGFSTKMPQMLNLP